MGFFQKILDKFSGAPADTGNAAEKEMFTQKYSAFQALLGANNAILMTMADMEDKLSGEYLIDRQYIVQNAAAISASVKDVIDRLNEIADGRYAELYERYRQISTGVEEAFIRRRPVSDGSLTVSFDALNRTMADLAGGKNANLGQMRNVVSVPVPRGFAITSTAYIRFMQHNGFLDKINQRLSGLSVDNMEALRTASKEIKELILNAEIPPDMQTAITETYDGVFNGHDIRVSIRSSAVEEDDEFSFAGQYSTYLNVSKDDIPVKYKAVIASLFSDNAIFYYKTKGFKESDMAMAVGVVEMINARAGGVMYSNDPNDPAIHNIIINAAWGLGTTIVDGTASAQTYTLAKEPQLQIISRNIPHQSAMAVCNDSGSIDDVQTPQAMHEAASLSDAEIMELSKYAQILERHFGLPQDIEWAVDQSGQLFFLQTRPLHIYTHEPSPHVPTDIKGHKRLIEKGVVTCKGVGHGKAFIIRREDDLFDFPEGGVLIARTTSPRYVTVMNKAAAIVTNIGGATGHMASLAREYRLPTLLDTEIATSVISHGQEITVDAVNGYVYDGYVRELIDNYENKPNPFKDTLLFRILSQALKWIVPLNLIHPETEEFCPKNCATYHDITRFAHEKAMQHMFSITDIAAVHSGYGAVRMVTGLPIDLYVIDLGGGIDGIPKRINPEHITSMPFNAFFSGLNAMPWPQGRPLDVGGFMGMVANSATMSEAQMVEMAKCSFTFLSKNYMNFSIRLGYHLSLVEAYVSDNLNDNYIKFHFNGGGAQLDRRIRRVSLIAEILREMDFDSIIVTGDVIDARLSKYKRQFIEQKLTIMGKLTVYTKQLDMVMYNDSVTDHYKAEFIKDHIAGSVRQQQG
ncbi:MAG: PEP-utilizing enzyme [Candidatus Magnetominusculus sp. LBB02]|nr:PEP-utilizing enzyme [Candidatus Magnetominusculus sp. LBB02]